MDQKSEVGSQKSQARDQKLGVRDRWEEVRGDLWYTVSGWQPTNNLRRGTRNASRYTGKHLPSTKPLR